MYLTYFQYIIVSASRQKETAVSISISFNKKNKLYYLKKMGFSPKKVATKQKNS